MILIHHINTHLGHQIYVPQETFLYLFKTIFSDKNSCSHHNQYERFRRPRRQNINLVAISPPRTEERSWYKTKVYLIEKG